MGHELIFKAAKKTAFIIPIYLINGQVRLKDKFHIPGQLKPT